LQAIVTAFRQAGPSGETNLAQALASLGDAQLHLGQLSLAITALRETVAIREKSPDDLWELAQARERLGEALTGNRNAEASVLLKSAARDLEGQLGADHHETVRAKAAVTHLQG
jgi:hypothetical protein